MACRVHPWLYHFTLTGKPIHYFMSPDIVILASALNVPKLYASEMAKKTSFLSPHCRLTPSCYATPSSISMNLIPPECGLRGLHFCRWQYASIFFQIFVQAPKDARSTSRSAYWPFKVIRGRWFSCHLNSNLSSISHRFWDTTAYRLKIANFPYTTSVQPQIWKCSLCTKWLKFCVRRAKTLG